jgi:predicted nucleic acid-binding protein
LPGSRREEVYFLDTSAIVKRYVLEPGSSLVDEVYSNAYRGLVRLALSYWNIAEAAVVFDKYERRLGLNARRLLSSLLSESATLSRLRRLLVVGVSPSILRESVELVLKHHVYVADALQVASAKSIKSDRFVTGDGDLARIAKAEGLSTVYLGEA